MSERSFQIFELSSIGRVTLDAFVGHEGHDCTLEVGRRDGEKLRERFSSSRGSRNSKDFVFMEKKQNQLSQRLFTLFGL